MGLPAIHGTVFLDEAWARTESESSVVVGGYLSGRRPGSIYLLDLPREGDRVYFGLPLARLQTRKSDGCLIPSPLTGQIVQLNQTIRTSPQSLWRDPCGSGWIARIAPDEMAGSLKTCSRRTVQLISLNAQPSRQLLVRLLQLGCEVERADVQRVIGQVNRQPRIVVVLDGVGRTSRLVPVVDWLARVAPAVSLLVVTDRGEVGDWVTSATRVIEYPLRLGYDPDLNEALHASFWPRPRLVREASSRAGVTEHIQRFQIASGRGRQVTVILASEVLNQFGGLERELVSTAMDNTCYVRVPVEPIGSLAAEIDLAKRRGHHLAVVEALDSGRIPGSITVAPPRIANRVKGGWDRSLIRIAVQPAGIKGYHLVFDEQTTRALARNLFRQVCDPLELGRSATGVSGRQATRSLS